MAKVLILLGGNSPEREVSLRSGRSVAEAAGKAGHTVFEYDPINGYIGLDDYMNKVDVVLPILHGVGCEDGEIQTELEARNFKYLGSDSKVSQLCFDKVKSKQKIEELGFKTPASEIVNRSSFENSGLRSGKFVLKPIEGGSTIDTFIVRDEQDHFDSNVFDKYEKMLIEELVEGNEITVPVLAGSALPVIEIIPPAGEDFDYENKYNGETQELCPPANVEDDLQKKAQSIAEKLHNYVGCRHLSRTDIILSADGTPYVLEINTMPGMTSQSLFPKAAAEAGLSMEQLVDKFVQMAAS
jgi:D-alanine-D-alanine ligase